MVSRRTNAGRPRKPGAIHELEGTKSRTVATSAIEFPPLSAQDPPDFLLEPGREKWAQIISWLELVPGLLAQADYDLLAQYCVAYDSFVISNEQVRRLGPVAIKMPSGAFKVQSECMKIMRDIAKEFGMTPVAREHIRSKAPEQKEDDPFAAIFALRQSG